MDTELSVLQDWMKEERTSLESLRTQYNLGDQFTKALRRVKLYEQSDVIMGCHIPSFSLLYISVTSHPFPLTQYHVTHCICLLVVVTHCN